jgi:ribonuclease P/MRP protein subunit RPP40
MKANRVLGLIKKTFTTKSEATIPLLYMTLVRPHLEYANTIWGPHYKEDQKMVENVQRRATKMISSIKNLPYEARLQHLNLPSLQHRRKRGDMIETYKIMTGKLNIDRNSIFQFNSTNTRGHPFKIFKQHAKSFLKSHVFSQRVVNAWNKLPDKVIEAKSTNEFKNLIDKHWSEQKFETPFNT